MEFAVGFSTVDQVLGTWVQVAIYNSVPSSGNPATDFSGEWKALVKPETYAGAVEPSPTTTTIDGWTYNSGKSTFQWQGKSGHTELTNISGYGVMVSVHVGTNSDKYSAQIDRFVKSIQLKKPAQQVQSTPAQNTTVSNATIAAPITVTGALGTQGITRSTTNFDDGWVAQPFADYVRVTKGSVTVLLHYAMAIDDPMGAADNIATVLWDRLMMSRYRVSNLKAFQNAQWRSLRRRRQSFKESFRTNPKLRRWLTITSSRFHRMILWVIGKRVRVLVSICTTRRRVTMLA